MRLNKANRKIAVKLIKSYKDKKNQEPYANIRWHDVTWAILARTGITSDQIENYIEL